MAIDLTATEIMDGLKYIVNTIIIPYGVYLLKRLTNMEEKIVELDRKMDVKVVEIDRKIEGIDHTVRGPNGDNGMRSRLAKIETIVDNISGALVRLTGQAVRNVKGIDQGDK